MNTILRTTALTSLLALALTACAPSQDGDTSDASSVSAEASAEATQSPSSTSTATPTESPSEPTETESSAPSGAVGPDAATATAPADKENNTDPAAEKPGSAATQGGSDGGMSPGAPNIPNNGKGDITTPFRNNPGASYAKQFVKTVEMSPEGVVTVHTNLTRPADPGADQGFAKNSVEVCKAAVSIIRGDMDTPRVVKVVDTAGTLIATNTPKNRAHEECSWV